MKLAAVLAAKGSRVYTVRPEVSVREAVAELAANNIGALIICDRPGAPVGIVSERDVIRRMNIDDGVLDAPISELMTSPVILGTSNDDLDSVLRTMTDRRFRHLPVVDDGELVGMVTIGDLVKAQLAEFRGAVATLETRLMDD
jgi:CBS domain-containing protein